jgi:hypothetical protein
MDARSLFRHRLHPTRWGFFVGALLIIGCVLLAAGSLSVMGLATARAAPPTVQGERVECGPDAAPCS